MHYIDPGFLPEQLHQKMMRRAAPWRRVAQHTWLRLRVLHKRRSVRTDRPVEQKGKSDCRKLHHGLEALDRIICQIPIEARTHGKRTRCHEQRVPVGRGTRNQRGADSAARSGTVLDQETLRPALLEGFGNPAREDVRSSTRAERDDIRDRAARYALSDGRSSECAGSCDACCFQDRTSGQRFHLLSSLTVCWLFWSRFSSCAERCRRSAFPGAPS